MEIAVDFHTNEQYDIRIYFCSFIILDVTNCSERVFKEFRYYKTSYLEPSSDNIINIGVWFKNRNCTVNILHDPKINIFGKLRHYIFKRSFNSLLNGK